MSQVKNKDKGFTLFELVIASLLVVTIFGAALSLQVVNDQMYTLTMAEKELLQEINLALSHIQLQLRNIDPAFQISVDTSIPNEIKVTNPNTGSLVSRYVWDDPSDQLWYYPTGSGSYQVVAKRLSSFLVSYTDANGDGKIPYFTLLVKAKGKWGGLDKEVVVRENIGARLYHATMILIT